METRKINNWLQIAPVELETHQIYNCFLILAWIFCQPHHSIHHKLQSETPHNWYRRINGVKHFRTSAADTVWSSCSALSTSFIICQHNSHSLPQLPELPQTSPPTTGISATVWSKLLKLSSNISKSTKTHHHFQPLKDTEQLHIHTALLTFTSTLFHIFPLLPTPILPPLRFFLPWISCKDCHWRTQNFSWKPVESSGEENKNHRSKQSKNRGSWGKNQR